MRKILLFSLMFVGCATNKIADGEKSIFIREFKLKYFESCLKKGLDDSAEVSAFLAQDKSGYGEPVLGLLYLSMDSLAQSRLNKVRSTEAEATGQKMEGTERDQILGFCLCEYEARWLDSLANQRYRTRYKN